MNSSQSLWSELPLTAGIATLVCYAGVFNDVIGVEEVASRLGVSGGAEFHAALEELCQRGSIVVRNGFAGLPDLDDKITVKPEKIATAQHLIRCRLDGLKALARNPLIRFIGISGSLAANNPARDRNNHVDLDVFLITRSQCLWLYGILRGLRNRFPRRKREPVLCTNYVIDESNPLIANRNLFTATEMRNLIPFAGMDAYRKFLQANNWVDYYYPGLSGAPGPVPATSAGNLINKCLFVVFTIMRSIRWLDVDILREISFRADLPSGVSVHALKPRYGGYQALVQKKFSQLAEAWFPDLLDAGLIEKLFPDDLSAEIRNGHIDVAGIVSDAGIGLDYSKYGWQPILPKSGGLL